MDFAIISRELSENDRATFRKAHGFEPTIIPVAGGSWRHFGFVDTVAIIVNIANPIRQLSFAQIDAIFSATRLRGHIPAVQWGDLGLMVWADKPVHVVGASSWTREDSARGGVIRDRILSQPGQRGSWRRDLGQESGSEADVPERVAKDPYAIGFTGMGHVLPGTRAIAIGTSANGPFFEPSYSAVTQGHYSLSRTVDLLLPRHPGTPLKQALYEFARFLLSREGQQIVRDQGIFLPLRAPQTRRSLRLLGDQCSGALHGAPPPASGAIRN